MAKSGPESQMRRSPTMFHHPDKDNKSILKRQSTGSDAYIEGGLFSLIARHRFFENGTLAVITFNALWIAIDTDNNTAAMILDAKPIFQVVEHLFCFYFSLEWYIRFMAFRSKRDCLGDRWFMFDSALVFMMVMETWVTTSIVLALGQGGSSSGLGNASILRLMRLLRLTRLARMLRSMPELMILIKGMVAASRSVFFTMALLFLLLYLFAIALRQLTLDTDVGDKLFPSVPAAMYTLLLHGVFVDRMQVTADALGAENLVFAAIYFVFVALAALMVMNMLIGVLCEVVTAVAHAEKEEMTVKFVKGKMKRVMGTIDKGHHGNISKDEFVAMMENQQAIEILKEVGVDPVSLVDLADGIFDLEDDEPLDSSIGKELTFEEFMEIVLDLRGCNTASHKHIRDLTKVFKQEVHALSLKLRARARMSSISSASTVARTSAARLSVDSTAPFSDDGGGGRLSLESGAGAAGRFFVDSPARLSLDSAACPGNEAARLSVDSGAARVFEGSPARPPLDGACPGNAARTEATIPWEAAAAPTGVPEQELHMAMSSFSTAVRKARAPPPQEEEAAAAARLGHCRRSLLRWAAHVDDVLDREWAELRQMRRF